MDNHPCLLYTSDAADEIHSVTDLEKVPVQVSKDEVFRCFSLLPATTRCALPGTWQRGGGGASGENFCDQEG